MKILEIEKIYRSFRRKEFEDYFGKIGKFISNGHYKGDEWEVFIGEERIVYIGKIDFVEITINLRLSEDIKEDFIINLRKAFLRGGA